MGYCLEARGGDKQWQSCPWVQGHYTHMSCVCTRLEHCELPVTGAHDEKVFSVTDCTIKKPLLMFWLAASVNFYHGKLAISKYSISSLYSKNPLLMIVIITFLAVTISTSSGNSSTVQAPVSNKAYHTCTVLPPDCKHNHCKTHTFEESV